MFKLVFIALLCAIILGAIVSVRMLMHVHSLSFDGKKGITASALSTSLSDVSITILRYICGFFTILKL